MKAEFTVEASIILSVILLSLASVVRLAYNNKNKLQTTFLSDYEYLCENHESIYDPESYLRKIRSAQRLVEGSRRDGK